MHGVMEQGNDVTHNLRIVDENDAIHDVIVNDENDVTVSKDFERELVQNKDHIKRQLVQNTRDVEKRFDEKVDEQKEETIYSGWRPIPGQGIQCAPKNNRQDLHTNVNVQCFMDETQRCCIPNISTRGKGSSGSPGNGGVGSTKN